MHASIRERGRRQVRDRDPHPDDLRPPRSDGVLHADQRHLPGVRLLRGLRAHPAPSSRISHRHPRGLQPDLVAIRHHARRCAHHGCQPHG